MINVRQERLLNVLLTSLVPVSVKTFKEQENVSERTIRYDLEKIKSYLLSHGITHFNKRAVGYYLDLNDIQMQDLTQ
ncbi:MAG TPA: HTH domain-containing protein [Erysipelothrix sp.]|nr:HTH domain-containing protein [Erysipelothrix sp.]